jgi:NADH-quinone oxidoreductase subunit J
MAEVLFFIAGTGAIAGAIGVVTLRNPFYSVLALVFHLLSLAALFLLLRAEFVAAAQVVVYAGAVMVLYVFVVAYVGGTRSTALGSPVGRGQQALAVVFALALFVELMIAVLGSSLDGIAGEGAPYEPGFGSPAEIGRLLLTDFLLAFELASFLLLVAAVGAVVLARRRGGLHDVEGHVSFTDMLRPLGTGTMAEGVGGRTGVAARRPLGPASEEAGEEEPASAGAAAAPGSGAAAASSSAAASGEDGA